MNYPFTHLKNYSIFLLENHLDALGKDVVENAIQAELPVLKLLSNYSKEQLISLSVEALKTDILNPIIQETPFQKQEENIEKWKTNSLIVPANQLNMMDVTSIQNVRKNTFTNFILFYNCPIATLVSLVKEINLFFDTCIDLGLKAYEEIRQKELLEKSGMLNGILANIPVVITKLDNKGNITYSAGSGLRALGLADQALAGKNLFEIYPQAENTRKALEGKPIDFTGNAIGSSGELREFKTFYIPEENGALGFSIDITRQREAEEQFNYLVEGVKDYAIFMLNTDGTIASWNEGARALKGYSKEDIIGKHFSQFYPQEKRDALFPEYELKQAKIEGRFEDEGLRIRKDGTTFWANAIITPIYNQSKELLGFTKITRDLTERKLAEERLRRSEERYRLLTEAVKDYAIFMVSPEGTIDSWNEGAKRLKGYTEQEIIGKHISIFYTQEKKDIKYPEYELEQAKAVGRFEDEGLRVRKDGTTFYANVIITALYHGNELMGFSKITRDLTEKKKYEENLQKMNFDLEEKVKERTEALLKNNNDLKRINNDLDNFIYTASHDLKAPISNIEGLMHALYHDLQEQIETNPNLKIIRGLIDDSISRFQSTIKDLTEIAKIQKDAPESTEKIDLFGIVEDVKFSISDLVARNNASIVLNAKDCSNVHFVKKNLKSIFYNLISNGIKYRSPDRPPLIHITCAQDEQFYTITFRDNGLGIKEDNIDKMFTMFKRFHDHVEGSGVGLYIVKRIIENANGKIEVESTMGEGSLFKVFIPIQTSANKGQSA